MGFELFKGRGKRGRFGYPVVSVHVGGALSMNDVAYAEIGRPQAIDLYYSSQEKKVGIRRGQSGGEYSFPIRPFGENSFGVSARSFLSFYDIDFATTRRFKGVADGDMITVELAHPLPSRGGRKKQDRAAGEDTEEVVD